MSKEPPTKEMASLEVSATAPKGTAKRDALRSNELEVQAMWDECKAFESDAVEGDDDKNKFISS